MQCFDYGFIIYHSLLKTTKRSVIWCATIHSVIFYRSHRFILTATFVNRGTDRSVTFKFTENITDRSVVEISVKNLPKSVIFSKCVGNHFIAVCTSNWTELDCDCPIIFMSLVHLPWIMTDKCAEDM